MYPSSFEYHEASSVPDAISLLQEYEEAEILSGGQSLVPLQKNRLANPEYVIDLNPIEDLEYIEEGSDDVRLGALARHTAVRHHDAVREYAPLFSEAISQIADQQVRNQGTVGGTVAEADPSGDYLPPFKLLNPDVVVTGPDGDRVVPFEEFYLGMFTVDMDHEELITEVRLPHLEPVEGATAFGSTYKKHAERSGDYAIVGVAAIVHTDDEGVVVDADLAVGSVGPLFRAEEAEDEVVGTTLDDDTLEAVSETVTEVAMSDEMGREGQYREQMAGVFTKRALRTAYERATGEAEL
jgi:carbon-monoxide dehydrogenase medium subunit